MSNELTYRIFFFRKIRKNRNTYRNLLIDIAIIFKDFDNLIEKQVELMRIRRKIDSRIEPHPIRLADYNVNNALASEVLNYGVEI
jgi:hypothetical protein